jgi:cell division protein FtsQ
MSRVSGLLGRGRTTTPSGIAAPADRRFRRPDVRPGRRRRLDQAALIVLRWVLPAVVVLGTGAYATVRLFRSDVMKVDHVVVRGNVRLSVAEVEALVDGIHKENILQVNLEAYRRRVLDSPWVADVAVSRVLPSTVELQVTERVPLAVARVAQVLYLVDTTGAVIDEFGPQYRQYDLPMIDGLVHTSPNGVAAADAGRVELVRRLMAALAEQPALRRQLSQIDVHGAHNIAVMFEGDPTWLQLGDANFIARLRTYLELAPTLHEKFADMDYVDLRFEERVFVRARHDPVKIVKTAQGR